MYGKPNSEMMVYVIMGFLEAGKTSLIKDILQDELFDDRSKTLILACEDGEEEYEAPFLEKSLSEVEFIEDEESFNGKVIQKFLKKHRPDRIIIEYNGMWPTKHIPELYDDLEEILFDREVIFQTIDVMNDETFSLYMKNMPSLMVDQFRVAEMIIDNRCTVEKTNKLAVRGSVKAVNPRAQIIYESEDDAFYEMEEVMPFDIHADIIEISPDDFGLWYTDMLDHPDTYEGKMIQVTGLIQKPPAVPKGFVVFGRMAMTCCADDIQYMGFLCKGDDWSAFSNKQYVTIVARFEFKYMKEYGEPGPVFYAESVEAAEKPKEELVYFN
ncbi:MAG: GTPase [Lachnospiraceae bacterium]|nr:GTPase [Lachnospiraceae bacterium]